jgi:biopolymer transport protein ExbD
MASNSIKRQRKRRRIDHDGDPEFQVAPMVDVLLVLMLFFMAITSTEVLKKEKNIQLADAKHAKPPEPGKNKDQIIVNVDWDGFNSVPVFSLNGLTYPDAASMQSYLAQQHAANPAAFVVIRADRNTEYSNISDLMKTCADAGIESVTFAVLINNNNTQAHGAAH